MVGRVTYGGAPVKFWRMQDRSRGRRPRGDSWSRGEASAAVGEGSEVVERRCTAAQGLCAAVEMRRSRGAAVVKKGRPGDLGAWARDGNPGDLGQLLQSGRKTRRRRETRPTGGPA